MSISRSDVSKVALLARLELRGPEIEKMARELAQIVGYVDQLSELPTDAIEPMAHPLELCNVFAEDRLEPSLERSEALRGAPHHNGACYLVPAVLGE